MRIGQSQIGAGLALLAAALLVFQAGRMAWRLSQAAELARRSEPLQQRPAEAVLRLLIVGDSTGVGTGASAPSASLAGLIGAGHPRLWIDNRSRDGARFAGVAAQLAGDERFDAVLVLAGGNDVIRLTGDDALRESIDRVAAQARLRADTVVLMPAGNVGNAPFFPPPLSWWMSARSRELHAMVREAAARHGATYVRLYEKTADDPFVQQPALNAADGLHPSDAGYRVWHAELMKQSPLAAQLAPTRSPDLTR